MSNGYALFNYQFAIQKGIVRRYLNGGPDCTALDGPSFAKAQVPNEKSMSANVVILQGPVTNYEKIPKFKKLVDGITKYSHFEFTSRGMLIFKSSGVGLGKEIRMDKLDSLTSYEPEIITPTGQIEITKNIDPILLRPKKASLIKIKEMGIQQTANIKESGDDEEFPKFKCSNDPCTAAFSEHDDLLRHISSNVCYVSKRRTENWHGVAQRKYYNRMAVGQAASSMAFYLDTLPAVTIPRSLLPFGHDPNDDFDERHQGFAQKSSRTNEEFDGDVKVSMLEWHDFNHTLDSYHFTRLIYILVLQDFLDELFARGIDNPSAKVTAREAHNLMRTARKDGRKRFKATQYLDVEQIDGYFSRRLANIKAGKNPRKRKADDSDILQQQVEEAVDERKKSCMDILEKIEADEKELATFHPLPVLVVFKV